MSPVMLCVRPRTTAWAPSRLHGAVSVQPWVAVAVGAAYSVICVLADAAGAKATRLARPTAAAVRAARTGFGLGIRAGVIDGAPLGFAAVGAVRSVAAQGDAASGLVGLWELTVTSSADFLY